MIRKASAEEEGAARACISALTAPLPVVPKGRRGR